MRHALPFHFIPPSGSLIEPTESLDRTERNIKETDNYLKQAGRQLDGLESTVGQMKNTFTPNLHKNKLSAYEAINREVSTAREKYTDIPILIKQPNDFCVYCDLLEVVDSCSHGGWVMDCSGAWTSSFWGTHIPLFE